VKRPAVVKAARAWALVTLLCFASASLAAQEAQGLAERVKTAFQTHFLVTDFDAAEGELLTLIQDCDASCPRSELARAWMYIGIVRGSGRQLAEEAKQAFEQALALDPKVGLDTSVATPETVLWFAEVGGKVEAQRLAEAKHATTPEPVRVRSEAELRQVAARAGLVCGPKLSELQTRRSLPVWCEARDNFWRVTLRYLGFNADGWVSRRLDQIGPRFQGEVPCAVTEFAGPLKYFVTVTDRSGGLVATLGSIKEPISVEVAEQVSGPPPAPPGSKPAERCAEQETCPPDFPGCDDGRDVTARGTLDWGQACEQSRQCKPGLMCLAGLCEPSPECDVGSDCESGICRDRRCELGQLEAARQRPLVSYVGVHFAADLGPVAGDNVCSASNAEFACFTRDGRAYPAELPERLAVEPGEPGDAYPDASIGGFASGSLRVLLSYDRLVSGELSLGGRLGVAFNGAPTQVDEPAFLPVHVEARASYWLFGTEHVGLRPFVALAGGLAQVDLRKNLNVYDCSSESTRSDFEDCLNGAGDYETRPAELPRLRVSAARKLGRGFLSASAGVWVPVFQNMGVVPALSALIMFPEVGFVLQPSVGVGVGF
jgi:hypothetical protein